MLKLVVLNGPLQGEEFSLIEGLTIGSAASNTIKISSQENVEVHCDASGNFVLTSANKKNEIDLGGELSSKIEILPGLIFSIGEIGFSIQEGAAVDSSNSIRIDEVLTENSKLVDTVYPIEKPIQIDFVRGALLNSQIEINWHPYKIGVKSVLHHFIDENINIDDDILSFEQSIESNNADTLIRPFISNFISINKTLVSKPTIVKNGDLVEFSDTAFYIRIK